MSGLDPKKILAVARKEFRQAGRDPLSLLVLLAFPTFLLVLFGYAVNFDVTHVPLAVQDRDRSAASRELISSFTASDAFDLVGNLEPGADVERVLAGRRARLVLVIPEDYGRDLAAGRTGEVQTLVDGTDSGTATAVLRYAAALIATENAERTGAGALGAAGPRGGVPGAIAYEPRIWYNPELRSSHFLVPGLIGYILMITGVLATSLSVVREKERGTMEQLRVAPVRTIELLLGKTIPYLLISLAAATAVTAAARLLFGVAITGSLLDLLAITLVFIVVALTLGLLVSTLADTQAVAFQMGVLTSVLPNLLLSGFVFPIRNMPPVLQAITRIVPARYYLVVIRGIILKGATLSTYPTEVGCLALFAALALALAARRLLSGEA